MKDLVRRRKVIINQSIMSGAMVRTHGTDSRCASFEIPIRKCLDIEAKSHACLGDCFVVWVVNSGPTQLILMFPNYRVLMCSFSISHDIPVSA